MYREGGALLVTLSGQPRSRAAGATSPWGTDLCVLSRSTAQAGLVTPVPEHGGGSAAVPTGPLQPWKQRLRRCGGMVAMLCQLGWRGAEATAGPFALKLKQTRALSCSHLC